MSTTAIAVNWSDDSAESERPLTLGEEAYIVLERMIVTGQLAPGQWVSETELMDLSRHSRASVRYAMQRLKDQELIELFPRKGSQVCPEDYTKQFRALELRRVVESLIARLAARRSNAAMKKKFKEVADSFQIAARNADPIAMIELDLQAYSLMLIAANNPFATKAMSSVKGLSRRFWILHHKKHGDVTKMASAHSQVAYAISLGDMVRAEQTVSELMDYVEKFTLEVVGYSADSLSK